MKREGERSIRSRKKSDEYVECMMCHRLVLSTEIRHLKTRLPTGQMFQAEVCKLCIVDPNKTRYYIQQQLRKKK
jgi:hypothetical protein